MKILLILLTYILCVSCSEGTTSANQPNKQNPIKVSVNQLSIELVDYDSISIRSNSNFVVNSKDIERILIGTKVNDVFIIQDSILFTYLGDEDVYKVEFSTGQKVSSSLRIYNLSVRFILANTTFLDIDTLMAMYKYPYNSAEIFKTFDEIFSGAGESGPDRVQDFKLNIDNMCICPTGANFLWEYDFSSEHIKQLVEGQCDYIAHDSIYVFFAIASSYYYFRYDVENDTTEWFPLGTEETEYQFLGGIDAYNGSLYAILYSNDISNSIINIYDLSGNLLESIPYGRETHYMTIHKNIIYSISRTGYQPLISRFDLNTKVFIEDRLYPATSWYGIDILEDEFYYVDLSKKFIGKIPISQLE